MHFALALTFEAGEEVTVLLLTEVAFRRSLFIWLLIVPQLLFFQLDGLFVCKCHRSQIWYLVLVAEEATDLMDPQFLLLVANSSVHSFAPDLANFAGKFCPFVDALGALKGSLLKVYFLGHSPKASLVGLLIATTVTFEHWILRIDLALDLHPIANATALSHEFLLWRGCLRCSCFILRIILFPATSFRFFSIVRL